MDLTWVYQKMTDNNFNNLVIGESYEYRLMTVIITDIKNNVVFFKDEGIFESEGFADKKHWHEFIRGCKLFCVTVYH